MRSSTASRRPDHAPALNCSRRRETFIKTTAPPTLFIKQRVVFLTPTPEHAKRRIISSRYPRHLPEPTFGEPALWRHCGEDVSRSFELRPRLPLPQHKTQWVLFAKRRPIVAVRAASNTFATSARSTLLQRYVYVTAFMAACRGSPAAATLALSLSPSLATTIVPMTVPSC